MDWNCLWNLSKKGWKVTVNQDNVLQNIRNITIRVAGVGRSRVFGWSRDLFLVLLPTQLLIYCKKWKRDSNIKPTETVKEERVLSSNNSYSVFLLLCRNWSIITVLICTFNMYSSCLKKCFFLGWKLWVCKYVCRVHFTGNSLLIQVR